MIIKVRGDSRSALACPHLPASIAANYVLPRMLLAQPLGQGWTRRELLTCRSFIIPIPGSFAETFYRGGLN
jgi:hypothetical protein